MAKQHNRLKHLLTTNLEAKGLPKFKRSIEKEIMKHDKDFKRYRKEREEHRLRALDEIAQTRENIKAILESKLDEINKLFYKRKKELQEKEAIMTEEELIEYRKMQDKRYTLGNRLDKFLMQGKTGYGEEDLISENPSDSDTVSTNASDEVEQTEKSIREIVSEHLAMGEIPSNFKYSSRYRYPYDPKLNTSGKWDLWKQPWFIETFPKHLLDVLRETSREYLKKSSRDDSEEIGEEQESAEAAQKDLLSDRSEE